MLKKTSRKLTITLVDPLNDRIQYVCRCACMLVILYLQIKHYIYIYNVVSIDLLMFRLQSESNIIRKEVTRAGYHEPWKVTFDGFFEWKEKVTSWGGEVISWSWQPQLIRSFGNNHIMFYTSSPTLHTTTPLTPSAWSLYILLTLM